MLEEDEEVRFRLLPEESKEITTCCTKNTTDFLGNWESINGGKEHWVHNTSEFGDCSICSRNKLLYRLKSILTPYFICDECVHDEDIRSKVLIKCLEKPQVIDTKELEQKREELKCLNEELELVENTKANMILIFNKNKEDIKSKKRILKNQIRELDFKIGIETRPYAFLVQEVPSYIERENYDVSEGEVFRTAVTGELLPTKNPDLYWNWVDNWHLDPILDRDNICLDNLTKKLKYKHAGDGYDKITTTKLDNGRVKYHILRQEDILIFRKKSI